MTSLELSKILIETIEGLEKTRLEPLPFRDSQEASKKFLILLQTIGNVATILGANDFKEKEAPK